VAVDLGHADSGMSVAVCYSSRVNVTVTSLLTAIVSVGCAVAFSADSGKWISAVPAEQRDTLPKRLDAYVKAYRSRDWGKLFDFISDAGRGGVDRPAFVARMKAAHRKDFSNSPDLLTFRPARTTKSNKTEYDVYGCGSAQREGQSFNGVALVHAVFEHGDWSFSGWSFTEFPNEPCKTLSDPSWETPGPMEWSRPMEELRGDPAGAPFHIDSKK